MEIDISALQELPPQEEPKLGGIRPADCCPVAPVPTTLMTCFGCTFSHN
ncbi:ALQxL family class IV lanthipeptide [Amycolatopsis antarctica]